MSRADLPGSMSSNGANSWSGEYPYREPGSRRRKLAGYLKAANELRQTYQQQYTAQWSQRNIEPEEDLGVPGAVLDASVVRSGDEEMVLFPSYARRHIKRNPEERRKGYDPADGNEGSGEPFRDEWQTEEEDKAVVDVDVRGWIYSPHRGPLNRRNRLLIGLARKLSGIPAPSPNQNDGREPSQSPSNRKGAEDGSSRQEEELVSREAQSILRKGEGEADVASRGGYSERPPRDSGRNSDNSGRSTSPDVHSGPETGHLARPVTLSSTSLDQDDASIKSVSTRSSWSQPSDMTPAELRVANAHLMARLKPFLTNPVVGIGITAFFWNETSSQSRSTYTNDSGHFFLRAALDFIPTNVRVLASENLSVSEDVRITEAKGISLISDIDDTIKHSGIGSGAKEIFRNTFVRELRDLTIAGVKEWYSKMAHMGVQMHYVSNAPWQLFPLLKSYFSMTGLPPGSFHLKQYNGMLQGIFEPVAERKKGTLEKIIRDFPERRFILVGDSGEADLEVYTDIATAHRGRILGIFIRDVTTSEKHNFFDQSMRHLNGSNPSSRSSSRVELALDRSDNPESRPPLPARRPIERVQTDPTESGPKMGTLIDFGDNDKGDVEPPQDLSGLYNETRKCDATTDSRAKPRSNPPPRPSKPSALRSSPSEAKIDFMRPNTEGPPAKKVPPTPPKPRLSNRNSASQPQLSSPPSQERNAGKNPNPSEPNSYSSAVRDTVASAYNKMPSPASYLYGNTSNAAASSQNGSGNTQTTRDQPPPPPPPPRRGMPSATGFSSNAAAAAQYASNRLSGNWNGAPDQGAGNGLSYGAYNGPPLDKKVDLWLRRWDRAKGILERERVVLRTWRVGSDVMNDAMRLVEKAFQDEQRRR